MKRLLLAVPLVLLLTASAHGATLVRVDGIGPLKMGMSRMAALDTGWLSNRHSGCPLGGKPYPIDYDLEGSSAPAGIEGSAEFTGGTLTNLAFSSGIRTSTGVVPGKTTILGMLKRYRDAGFKASARYEETFDGTFVNVKRKGGKQLLSGFTNNKVISVIGIPYVPVCE
jgi:hypothetical protein